MKIDSLPSSEVAPFYNDYLTLVDANTTLVELLKNGINDYKAISAKITKLNKQKFSYADQKWTVQDLLLHLIDTERIFCYRALCIARGDQTFFPGFDENDYVIYAAANNRSFESLSDEFSAVRLATVELFKSFTANQVAALGTASAKQVSVRAIGFIIVGHFNHHLNILQNRYLI